MGFDCAQGSGAGAALERGRVSGSVDASHMQGGGVAFWSRGQLRRWVGGLGGAAVSGGVIGQGQASRLHGSSPHITRDLDGLAALTAHLL